MDRSTLSEVIIQELGALFMAAVQEAGPELLTTDLDGIERRLQAVARQVFGQVLERVVAAPTPAAAATIRTTRAYFAEHAARMDYPRFVAQHLPIGAGAIESLCQSLIAEREKGAGLRWTGSGAQAVASLRALHRSGDWAAFWQRHPLRPIPRQRATAPAAPPVSSAAPGAPCASSSPSQPVDIVPAPIPAPVPHDATSASRPSPSDPWRRMPVGRARCA